MSRQKIKNNIKNCVYLFQCNFFLIPFEMKILQKMKEENRKDGFLWKI
jgi:hypothetical protein